MRAKLQSLQEAWTGRIVMLILAIGIGLRLARYLDRRPLWIDEALIALNVLGRSPRSYLQPLDILQISPLGFLWTEWGVTRLGGTGEHALRLVPLVASIVALVMFARLTVRILEPGPALLATALAALSPLLIYYSAEVKSYAFDWLCVVLMMHTTLDIFEEPSDRAWIRWGVAAAFSAMMSTSAPLFVAGCGVALLANRSVRAGTRGVWRLMTAGAPAALIFVLQLLTTYSSPQTRMFMHTYWDEEFLKPGIGSMLMGGVHAMRELWKTVLSSNRFMEDLPRGAMALILGTSLVGFVAIARKSLVVGLMLVAPVVLASLASLAKFWPLAPRLLLFAVPLVLLSLAAGLSAIARYAPKRAGPLLVGIPSAFLLLVGTVGIRADWDSERFPALPDALQYMTRSVSPGATVYMGAELVPVCYYYLRWHPDRDALGGAPSTGEYNCNLRRARVVNGTYPLVPVAGQPVMATPDGDVADREWVESEVRRILEPHAPEVWVLINRMRGPRLSVLAKLDSSGVVRVEERTLPHLTLRKYHVVSRMFGSR